MKKNSIFKWLVIVAILGIFVFSACKNAPAPQKKIVVTGISSVHNGRYGVVAFGPSSGDMVAWNPPAPISNGMFNSSLYNYGDYSVPFTGSGTYMVMLLIFDSTASNVLWSGVIFAKSITEETTTLSYNEFMNVPTSIQQSPLSIRDVLPEILKLYE